MVALFLAAYRAATSSYLDELDEQISSPGIGSFFGWPLAVAPKFLRTATRVLETSEEVPAHERLMTIGKERGERPTLQNCEENGLE
jgi:hypothetical protein